MQVVTKLVHLLSQLWVMTNPAPLIQVHEMTNFYLALYSGICFDLLFFFILSISCFMLLCTTYIFCFVFLVAIHVYATLVMDGRAHWLKSLWADQKLHFMIILSSQKVFQLLTNLLPLSFIILILIHCPRCIKSLIHSRKVSSVIISFDLQHSWL